MHIYINNVYEPITVAVEEKPIPRKRDRDHQAISKFINERRVLRKNKKLESINKTQRENEQRKENLADLENFTRGQRVCYLLYCCLYIITFNIFYNYIFFLFFIHYQI